MGNPNYLNEELIKLLEPIYAHDCDGSKLDLLSEALLALEDILLSKNEEELKNSSRIEAISYLALAEAMNDRRKNNANESLSTYIAPEEIILRMRLTNKKLDLQQLRWHKDYCLSDRSGSVEDDYLNFVDEEIKTLESEIVKIESELMEVSNGRNEAGI